jgi:hypothetical protein
MTWCDGYLPVPTMRREVKERSAMTRGMTGSLEPDVFFPAVILSSAHEIHDLHVVAFGDRRRVECRAPEDDEIEFDGDASRIDLELAEKIGDGHRRSQLEGLAVQGDLHESYNVTGSGLRIRI